MGGLYSFEYVHVDYSGDAEVASVTFIGGIRIEPSPSNTLILFVASISVSADDEEEDTQSGQILHNRLERCERDLISYPSESLVSDAIKT